MRVRCMGLENQIQLRIGSSSEVSNIINIYTIRSASSLIGSFRCRAYSKYYGCNMGTVSYSRCVIFVVMRLNWILSFAVFLCYYIDIILCFIIISGLHSIFSWIVLYLLHTRAWVNMYMCTLSLFIILRIYNVSTQQCKDLDIIVARIAPNTSI